MFKLSKLSKKNYIPNLKFEIFEKHPEVGKNENLIKKNLSTHMRFSNFDECNLYQNHNENLAFAIRTSQNFKKYIKNQNFIFSKVVGDRCLSLQLPRGQGSARMLLTHDLP